MRGSWPCCGLCQITFRLRYGRDTFFFIAPVGEALAQPEYLRCKPLSAGRRWGARGLAFESPPMRSPDRPTTAYFAHGPPDCLSARGGGRQAGTPSSLSRI